MKTKQKGNRNVRYARQELEEMGWLVDGVEKTGKFVKQKDLFALFDLVCVKEGYIMLLQVTTNRPHTHKDFKEFAKKYATSNIIITQWVWIDRKGFKCWYYNDFPNLLPTKIYENAK